MQRGDSKVATFHIASTAPSIYRLKINMHVTPRSISSSAAQSSAFIPLLSQHQAGDIQESTSGVPARPPGGVNRTRTITLQINHARRQTEKFKKQLASFENDSRKTLYSAAIRKFPPSTVILRNDGAEVSYAFTHEVRGHSGNSQTKVKARAQFNKVGELQALILDTTPPPDDGQQLILGEPIAGVKSSMTEARSDSRKYIRFADLMDVNTRLSSVESPRDEGSYPIGTEVIDAPPQSEVCAPDRRTISRVAIAQIKHFVEENIGLYPLDLALDRPFHSGHFFDIEEEIIALMMKGLYVHHFNNVLDPDAAPTDQEIQKLCRAVLQDVPDLYREPANKIVQHFAPDMPETLHIVYNEFSNDPYLGKILPDSRINLIIDPVKVDALAKLDLNNPLSLFIFDCENSLSERRTNAYANKVAKGWLHTMHNVNAAKPSGVDFIKELEAMVSGHGLFTTGQIGYGTYCSKDGKKELAACMDRLGKRYNVTSFAQVREHILMQRKSKAYVATLPPATEVPDTVMQTAKATTQTILELFEKYCGESTREFEHVKFTRVAVDAQTNDAILNAIQEKYLEDLADAESPKEKIMAAIDEYLETIRFHPLADGNGRNYRLLRFNMRLAEQGQDFAVIKFPIMAAGASRDEVYKMVEAAQQQNRNDWQQRPTAPSAPHDIAQHVAGKLRVGSLAVDLTPTTFYELISSGNSQALAENRAVIKSHIESLDRESRFRFLRAEGVARQPALANASLVGHANSVTEYGALLKEFPMSEEETLALLKADSVDSIPVFSIALYMGPKSTKSLIAAFSDVFVNSGLGKKSVLTLLSAARHDGVTGILLAASNEHGDRIREFGNAVNQCAEKFGFSEMEKAGLLAGKWNLDGMSVLNMALRDGKNIIKDYADVLKNSGLSKESVLEILACRRDDSVSGIVLACKNSNRTGLMEFGTAVGELGEIFGFTEKEKIDLLRAEALLTNGGTRLVPAADFARQSGLETSIAYRQAIKNAKISSRGERELMEARIAYQF